MQEVIREVARTTKYPASAFDFVRRGLDFTVRRTHGEPPEPVEAPEADAPPPSRHVTGPQLAEGLRDFALDQYGLLARAVLRSWHITSTLDFGRIVFAMVDAELMQKTDHDNLDDFAQVYDFSEAFTQPLRLTVAELGAGPGKA